MSALSGSGFWAMGGYGLYVWGSFGMCAVAVVAELWALRMRRRALLEEARQELVRARRREPVRQSGAGASP
ncbi:MAG: heme exporter protein CcmD [Pseudomonadota bacterium]